MTSFFRFQQILGNFAFSALCVLVILEIEQIPGIGTHGRDVSGDDFVQIFKLLILDPQGLAKTEGIDFLLFDYVDVLVDTLPGDFPGHC